MWTGAKVLISVLALPMLPLWAQSPKIPTEVETANPIRGEVALQGGKKVHFTYYFDHNALLDCVETGESLVCLTKSGNLLRFDGDALKMTWQAIVPGRGTAIAAANAGDVLVGTQQGEVLRVDPAMPVLEFVARTPGKIIWLSSSHLATKQDESITVVVDNLPEVLPWPGERDRQYDNRSAQVEGSEALPFYVAVFNHGGRKVFPLRIGRSPVLPNAYFLDRFDRLWMGTDLGEFGGRCSYMDLRNGSMHVVSKKVSGVLGFIPLRNGGLIAYGGTSHLGFHSGYIAQVSPQGMKDLSKFESNDWGRLPPAENHRTRKADSAAAEKQVATPENMPQGPVDLMIHDSLGGGYWVVSAQVVFHTDFDFKQWTKVADLGGRWFGGRRLSVGNTPTVERLLAEKSRPESLLAVMGRDGLERVNGENVERSSFKGQIESSIIDIWKTPIGLLFLSDDSDHAAWRHSDGAWQRMSFFPDRKPSDDYGYWDFAEPFGQSATGVLAFIGDSVLPGERDIVQLAPDGSVLVLNSWNGDSGELSTAFLAAADGSILRAEDGLDPANGKLWIQKGTEWRSAGRSKLGDGLERKMELYGRRFYPLGSVDAPDYFLDVQFGEILRLARNSDGSYEFAPATYKGKRTLTAVSDAVADGDGWYLLATAHGLLRFRPRDGARKSFKSPPSGGEMKSLCRDGEGRLWAVGDQLYVSPDDGRRWKPVQLPMLARTYNARIRPNPEDPRGLVLSIDGQGVVFLDW